MPGDLFRAEARIANLIFSVDINSLEDRLSCSTDDCGNFLSILLRTFSRLSLLIFFVFMILFLGL